MHGRPATPAFPADHIIARGSLTEAVLAKAALQASPAWLEELLAIADDGIISVDETQQIQVL
ncbi:MAG: hypothetical protein NVS4B9_41870 [Ktedonobacteraceae bacterium]